MKLQAGLLSRGYSSRSKKQNRDLAGLSVFQYYLVTLSRGLLNKNKPRVSRPAFILFFFKTQAIQAGLLTRGPANSRFIFI